jgi:hypothetical protein
MLKMPPCRGQASDLCISHYHASMPCLIFTGNGLIPWHSRCESMLDQPALTWHWSGKDFHMECNPLLDFITCFRIKVALDRQWTRIWHSL